MSTDIKCVVTKWPDTPNEEARVSGHFKSVLHEMAKHSTRLQVVFSGGGGVWPFQVKPKTRRHRVFGHFRSNLKPGDTGCLAISGPT